MRQISVMPKCELRYPGRQRYRLYIMLKFFTIILVLDAHSLTVMLERGHYYA